VSPNLSRLGRSLALPRVIDVSSIRLSSRFLPYARIWEGGQRAWTSFQLADADLGVDRGSFQAFVAGQLPERPAFLIMPETMHETTPVVKGPPQPFKNTACMRVLYLSNGARLPRSRDRPQESSPLRFRHPNSSRCIHFQNLCRTLCVRHSGRLRHLNRFFA
jgi:hypothetical protein